jgi:hypothetical protein
MDAGDHDRSVTPLALVILAWVLVGAPLVWGIVQTLKKASALFE